MTNQLYKNDIKENLKIFSDFKMEKEYSNKSKELNSLFNEFTYTKFYDNLKNYNNKLKSININSFYPISSEPNKNKRKLYKEFDISKIKSAIEKMKKKEKILKEKREHPYTERCLYSNPIYTLLKNKLKKEKKEKNEIENNEKDKAYKPSTPEIGRYNPLYEAVNKHTPQVIFSLKNFEEYNNNLNNKSKLILRRKNTQNNYNKIYNKTELNADSEYNSTTDRNEELQNKNKKASKNNIFYNTAITKKNKNKIESRNLNKNNHCLRFETYTERKPIINKIFYKTENDFNYEVPSFYSRKNVKGSVAFNKVSSNKKDKNYFEKIINQKKDIPSLGFYRPRYSLVNNKIMNIFFNGRKNEKNNLKIMKLKKILGSYNVRGEFQMFNFLNDENNAFIQREKEY